MERWRKSLPDLREIVPLIIRAVLIWLDWWVNG